MYKPILLGYEYNTDRDNGGVLYLIVTRKMMTFCLRSLESWLRLLSGNSKTRSSWLESWFVDIIPPKRPLYLCYPLDIVDIDTTVEIDVDIDIIE